MFIRRCASPAPATRRVPVDETLPGKLPQRKLVTTAAAGYSAYGNQIGLATGHVRRDLPRRLCGQAPGDRRGAWARRPMKTSAARRPRPGDVIILLGGAHGPRRLRRCNRLLQVPHAGFAVHLRRGGAKGQSPRRSASSQRLFRNPEATRMIKRCNDFGAGGVSVAIGELADGLDIDLECRSPQIRGPGRHGAGDFRIPGAHGLSWSRRKMSQSFMRCRQQAKILKHAVVVRDGYGKPAPDHASGTESPSFDHCARIPELQRRAQAHRRARGAARAGGKDLRRFQDWQEKIAALVCRPERLLPEAGWSSALTPPSARAQC